MLPLGLLAPLTGAADASGLDGAPGAADVSPARPLDGIELPASGEVASLPPALRRLEFVENLGQWSTPAAFVAVQGRTLLQVVEGGFVVDALPEGAEEPARLRFGFEGARRGVVPAGAAPLPGLRNYLKGDDPDRWVHGARSFEQVVYDELYEGIDLRLRDADGMPEYDLLLDPGADLARVVVRCEGVSELEVDEHGGLSMHSAQGVLRQSPPVTWCVLPSGAREPLACEFVVLDATSFGFRLAGHDPDLPVVIDPGLEWATYLGGSTLDLILGMGRTSQGEIVVAGTTTSPDFPTGLTTSGPTDCFVAKLDASGSTLLYSTLLGGTAEDFGLDVKVGAGDEVYVVGATNSPDLPTMNAFQPTPQGLFDGFVAELDASGGLVYASYLGGSAGDVAGALSVHAPGVLTISGATRSTDFPVTPGRVQASHAGGDSDYFLCRLDLGQPPASQLQYGTWLGGSAKDGMMVGSVIALSDPQLHTTASGVVTLVGRTTSTDIDRNPDGYDNSFNSTDSTAEDGYVARVDPAISGPDGVIYDTYLGGSSRDGARALAVDPAGVITVGGFTDSPDFPTTLGAFGTTFIDVHDAWLARLDPSQPAGTQQLVYSTLISGDGEDNLTDLALDAQGRVIAQGYTGAGGLESNVFPTTCGAFQTTYGGQKDSYLLYLDPAGNGASDLLYSTFVGGVMWDIRTFGLEVLSESPTLKVLSAGGSGEFGFPPPETWGFDSTPNGVEDGLLLRLELNPHTYCVAAPNSYSPDGAIICGSGSVSLADDDFTLSVTGAIPGQPGLFYFGPNPIQLPFGHGFRCVGGVVERLNPPSSADGSGVLSRAIDFNGAPGDQLTPGTPWYFQLWYRDPAAGGSNFNLSNGLKVVFTP